MADTYQTFSGTCVWKSRIDVDIHQWLLLLLLSINGYGCVEMCNLGDLWGPDVYKACTGKVSGDILPFFKGGESFRAIQKSHCCPELWYGDRI